MSESRDREQSTRRTPRGGSPGGAPRPGLTAIAGIGAGEATDVLSLTGVEAFLVQAARVDHDLSDAGRVDQIGALERVKGAVAAAQARLTVDLHDAQRTADQARGLDRATTARSVGTQVALARRDSPNRGNRHLGLAKALLVEMPHTLAALTAGIISEWQATILVRATACLTAEDRTIVDAQLSDRLGDLSDRRLEGVARAAADRIDPAAAVRRRAKAEADRRVTTRPAPDCMTQLSALLPVKDGVACHAALTRAADSARATGDPRTRSQVMADTLVERITGRTPAQGADVEVRVVMSTETFLGYGTQSGWVPDYGPIPAHLAYAWAHAGTPTAESNADPGTGRTRGSASGSSAGDSGTAHGARVADIDPDSPSGRAERARVFLRRMFSTPDQSRLVAMESGRREFTGLLAEFLGMRDQTCRMPFCDAPIRHHDHITPHTHGGPTNAANGQGLCEACNYLKEHPDWHARPGPDPNTSNQPHEVTWTTPTGHSYHSTAPPPLEV